MLTGIIEVASVILFAGSVWHATQFEGRPFAQQWFIAAYLFALIREDIMQVAFPDYFYAPSILRLGAAPALVSLLYGSLFYLGYVFARRLAPPTEYVPFAALVFVATACFALPIEATAAQVRWWLYEMPRPVIFGDMPVVAPLLWAGGAVLFYFVFQRLSATRLPERGRLYAMITFSPILAVLHVIYTLLLGAVL
jgi:hypothetical protein